MTRLRVAYLPQSLSSGGAERQMLALAERLPRDRFEVEFIVLSGSGVYDERATAAGLRIRRVARAATWGEPLPAKLWHRASKVLRYAALVRAGRYHVIDAWLYPADVLAAVMRPVTRTPVVIAGRRNIETERFFGPIEPTIASLVGRLTDVVVANSAAVASNAAEAGGIPPSKLRIIRNGVVVPQPVQASERLARRRAIGIIDPDEIVIGCVANFRQVKRHDWLISAFAALPHQLRKLRLVLVGDGPLRPAVERQVRALGLETRVLLLGSELNPEPLYATFDIAVQASSREGLPNAMLEAGAAGRAIVATDAGGSREIVLDGRTGLLVPVDSLSAFVSALQRMVSSADLRERLGSGAREHVAATFGMDRFVAEFAQLYEEQVAAKHVRR